MIVSTNEKSVRITSAERYKIFVSSDKVCVICLDIHDVAAVVPVPAMAGE